MIINKGYVALSISQALLEVFLIPSSTAVCSLRGSCCCSQLGGSLPVDQIENSSSLSSSS
jgi:hypothetical protein